MATNSVFPTRPLERRGIPSGKTVVLTVLAFLLALTLGLSAVDLNRPAPDTAAGSQSDQPVLDGRGKWAGYL